MGVSLKNIRKDIRMRKESDRQMSSVWLLVYLLSICVFVIAAGYTLVTLLDFFSSIDFSNPQLYPYSYGALPEEFASVWLTTGLTGLVNFAVSTVFMYLLVNRRGTHFKRQKFLSEDIITTVNSLAKIKNVDVEASVLSLERSVREANAEETEKSAILWAILSAFVPIVSLYVYYFLMKDFDMHERREDGFWEDLSRTFKKFGVNFSVPRRTEPMPHRSAVLYLILTIVTMGLFGVYWFFVMLKEPNEHFKRHIEAENQLLAALEPVAI
jgi:multisubunit Na+/H+ antiporter MnhB subunit